MFDLPDLALRIQAVLAQRSGWQVLLIPGGGAAADVVREWDRMHHLGEDRAHELAVESLSLGAALLRELLPSAVLVADRPAAAAAWNAQRLPILSVAPFLRAEERGTASAERLPHTWDVTSDSIAAWIAARWPAQELVLLKSVASPAAGARLCSAAADPACRSSTAAVDPCFARLAPALASIGWANLRDETPSIVPWRPDAPVLDAAASIP